MNKLSVAVVVLAVLSVLGGAWYLRHGASELPEETAQFAQTPEASEEAEAPVIKHPVPSLPLPDEQAAQQIGEEVAQAIDTPADAADGEAPAAEPPLPELDNSDTALRAELAGIAKPRLLESLFLLDNIIRRFVVTIDNIPGPKLPQQHVLNKSAEGRFLTVGEEGAEYINADNYERYTPYIRLLETLDTKTVASLYIRYYPLFQAAYVDLGYPSAYFNDRLVEVIDHLLATPDVQGRVMLVRPHVLYKFANPELEALSAGQKVLVRMGYANAIRVKAKLRELRNAVTLREPAP